VKFAALALDYDGTIATDGALHASVREAIGMVRQRGVTVVLVTGRRIDDLRRVAGDLACFDVVVGENGAVLEFPTSGRHLSVARAPGRQFIDALRNRGVEVSVGEVVVETRAEMAPQVLAVIRELEQPLILAFNRGRLMILPQAIGKSTGLRHALSALRVSIHNAVGIGDAENDHDLLDACEVGVAVAWGSPALRAVADEVVQGTGPDAVADYLRRIAAQSRLSTAQMGRRRLALGYEHNGDAVSLAIRGRTVLIAGEPGTGKSWLAGLLCEQLILQGYCLCIIDPEGDYRSLETLPGVITLGGDDPPPTARELVKALRHPDVSVIVDLSKLTHHRKSEYLRTLLPLLVTVRRHTGLPHKILLDEAQYYLAGPDTSELVDHELAGYILVTYRVSALAESIRAMSDVVVLVTRETDPHEARVLQQMARPTAHDVNTRLFGDLATNEAALLPGVDESHGVVRRFQLGPRLTAHVRHQTKYLDVPVLYEHAFVFGDGGPGPRAHTLKEFIGFLGSLPADRIEGHMRRHDFSRWLSEVFRDHLLARRVRALEDRTGRDENAKDLAADLAQSIRARYEAPQNV